MRRTAVTVAVLALCTAACSAQAGPDGGDLNVDCAARVVFNGVRYAGYGGMVNYPADTRPAGVATVPACQDGEQTDKVLVDAINGVPTSQAVLADGQLYVSDAAHPSAWVIAATTPRPCVLDRPTEIEGVWVAIPGGQGRTSDADDPKPPFDVVIDADEGLDLGEYSSVQVTAHVTAHTHPTLTAADLSGVLATGGRLSAVVHCDGRRFVADRLDPMPSS